MKRETLMEHAQILNNALYYMYAHIDSNIALESLARQCGMSSYHFHRIFKEQMGANFYETLQSIRLQKAANLLLTNRHSAISETAQACGYGSHSAFIRAFKQRFGVTPGEWKRGAYRDICSANLARSAYASAVVSDFSKLEPVIKKSTPVRVAYIRHKGYGRSIKAVWQRLQAYMLEYGEEGARQVGIHHDNPAIVPLEACSYVAGIEVDPSHAIAKRLSLFTIPSSLCAVFHFEGVYGEVLNLIAYIYLTWLPQSGFEAKTLPPYVIYEKNHFLSEDERFALEFYLPIRIS